MTPNSSSYIGLTQATDCLDLYHVFGHLAFAANYMMMHVGLMFAVVIATMMEVLM